MSETAIHVALVETASEEGIRTRRLYLKEHGPHELGWSYANILEVEKSLLRQLRRRGYFNLYLYVPGNRAGEVRYRMEVSGLKVSRERVAFTDPVDGRRYLVHCRMMIRCIEELEKGLSLQDLRSVDMRKPDLRHLQLGFLFIVDPEGGIGTG